MKVHQYVKSGDVQLAVYRWGEKQTNKPVILLVHGYPDSAQVWAECADMLALDYQVFAYDVRGAGQSDRPSAQADYALHHLANDMLAVIQAISPDKPVHLMGHDWGSIQSWEAVCDKEIANHIASYTSISGPSLDHAGHWIRRRLGSASVSDKLDLLKQSAHSWYIGLFHMPGADRLWKLGVGALWPLALQYIEGLKAEASDTQTADGEYGVNLYRANVRERVLNPRERRTDVPVQLVFPKQDHFMIESIWTELQHWVPNLWRSDVEAGHWLPLSHPALLAQKLRHFVEFIEQEEETPGLIRASKRARRRQGRHNGKLVVITGAGSGFGRETAILFAEQGADIIAVDINNEAAERTAQLCRLLGVSAWARQIDVSDAAQMQLLAAWVEQSFTAPDIVINNAGIGLAGSFFDTTDEDWNRVLDVNLRGVILGSRLFGEQMRSAGIKGHIVNVGSMASFTPARFMSAYATSKAAVRMLSDCLRAELADQDIGVSTICPGMSITNITRTTRFVGSSAEDEARQQRNATRLYQRRNLQPVQIAKAILTAVERKQDEVPVGIESRSSRWLMRLAPSLVHRAARLEPAV